jgi:hypothetical protein
MATGVSQHALRKASIVWVTALVTGVFTTGRVPTGAPGKVFSHISMETRLINKNTIFCEIYVRVFPIHKPLISLFEFLLTVSLFRFEGRDANREVTGRLHMMIDRCLGQRKILELYNQIINYLGYCNCCFLAHVFFQKKEKSGRKKEQKEKR